MADHFWKLLLFVSLAAIAVVAITVGRAREGAVAFTTLVPPSVETEVPPYLSAASVAAQDAFPSPRVADLDRGSVLVDQQVTASSFHKVGTEPPPPVQAASALIMDLANGQTYFDVQGDRRWPMASLTKLTAAVEVLRNLDEAATVTLAPEHFPVADNSTGRTLKMGDTYRVSDLLRTTLVVSSNEAAEALAGVYGRENFLAALNGIAREWGAFSTNFSDPTGLSAANQSTARDLAKIAAHIFADYPRVFQISRTPKISITELASAKAIPLVNINLFAGRADFLGGKTGYTDEAAENLLSIFSYAKRPIGIVVLGTGDRFGETEKLFAWFKNNFSLNQ